MRLGLLLLVWGCYDHHRVEAFRAEDGGVDVRVRADVSERCSGDSDDDGLSDVFEGTFDRDGDGLPNVGDLDSDGDGLTDGEESVACMPVSCGLVCAADFFTPDRDRDGVSDGDEVAAGTSPCDLDSDDDGCADPFDRGARCERPALLATCPFEGPSREGFASVVVDVPAHISGMEARLIIDGGSDVDFAITPLEGGAIRDERFVRVTEGDLLVFEVTAESCRMSIDPAQTVTVVLSVDGTMIDVTLLEVYFSSLNCPD
ncbi:MAG: hypothetical protein AAGE52_17910 [Myxococcota bacterium]